jgi:predicted nucleic acid-binding protein
MSQGSQAAQNELFLHDTSVMIHLVRGGEVGQRMLRSYDLINCQPRPLVSVVSLAEVRVLAEVNHWGERKREVLERTLQSLVVVDIHHPLVIDADVRIDLHARQHPKGARHMGKNDLMKGGRSPQAMPPGLWPSGHLQPQLRECFPIVLQLAAVQQLLLGQQPLIQLINSLEALLDRRDLLHRAQRGFEQQEWILFWYAERTFWCDGPAERGAGLGGESLRSAAGSPRFRLVLQRRSMA